MHGRIRVAVNGYGVIGKRVADAVRAQEDMTWWGWRRFPGMGWWCNLTRSSGAHELSAGLIDDSQKMTVAAMGVSDRGDLTQLAMSRHFIAAFTMR